jgi:hypothetical protein
MTVRLHPTYDREHDVLSVLEYGRVAEGQPDGCWRAVGGRVLVLHDGVNGPEVGVWVSEASRLDVHAGAVAGLWGHPRFDVPMVGLTAACAGDVILAARALFGGRASIGHGFLGDLREAEDDDEAEQIWRAALECGDMYAHLGLGRVLYALGRDQEAYRRSTPSRHACADAGAAADGERGRDPGCPGRRGSFDREVWHGRPSPRLPGWRSPRRAG